MNDPLRIPRSLLAISAITHFAFGFSFCVTTFGQDVDYLKDVKPLLKEKCYSCHSVLKQEGGLRLDARQLILAGGESGAAIVPDHAADSLLIERITDDEFLRMPPAEEGAALKPDEIEVLRKWIDAGASAPDEQPAASPLEHWAFQKITPKSNHATLTIDKILETKREQLRLRTQPAAPRSLLIRRLYLDLIGLPPTLEQLKDERPIAQIADELLASPHYGERWGRHWMDIWRYSDWYGLGAQLRYSQKHLWHWRDWIVNSLNEDKGYDRMLLEMLAGDELEPENLEVVKATGFLARNYYLFNRTTWLDSTIEHTGKAFLGLTFNCAKCHDHKYDPISQVDYYNFRAFLEPHQVRLDPLPGELDLEKNGLPRVFDDHLEAKTSLLVKGDPKRPDESIDISPQVPQLLNHFQSKINPIDLPVFAYAPSLREEIIESKREQLNASIAKASKELKEAQQTLKNTPKNEVDETPADNPAFDFVDQFDAPRPDFWEINSDNWKYENGQLLRTTATREPEYVVFRKQLPRDFEITCDYVTTGGSTYKSVTFRFDQTDDGQYDNFVYSSAHAPGPKIQAAFTRNGNTTYPPQGRVGQRIEVGKRYQLRFAVGDRLVNVWLDGKFVLAYEFPDRRPEGKLSLSGFDATVAFDSIEIRSLSADIDLKRPAGTGTPSADPKLAVEIAEAKLSLAQAELESFEATLQADLATYQEKDNQALNDLVRLAAEKQSLLIIRSAEVDRLVADDDEKKSKAAENKLKEAQTKLAKAQAGELKYDSLRTSRKALETPAHNFEDYPGVYPSQSTGRRLALAKWIVDRRNPLTARVAVNHIWMRHFGTPLVESVFDFGLRAPEPLHLDLLDYLSLELIDSGWSMKHLHRLMVNSRAYQLSSSTKDADEEILNRDADNHYYWRMNSRRMESQIIRDSLLCLAGQLDLTLGGPSVDVSSSSSKRRSIYFKHSRDQQQKFLSMFDDADFLQCYRRESSVVPQQALALSNSQLSLTLSQAIAQKITLQNQGADHQRFANKAFEVILCRKPSQQENEIISDYLVKMEAQLHQTSAELSLEERNLKLRQLLVHSLLNHNDFVSIR